LTVATGLVEYDQRQFLVVVRNLLALELACVAVTLGYFGSMC